MKLGFIKLAYTNDNDIDIEISLLSLTDL